MHSLLYHFQAVNKNVMAYLVQFLLAQIYLALVGDVLEDRANQA